jgi:alpha-tubulin suppressor-like RCC1 family protein
VVCWGSNASGQLGDGTTTDSTVPVTVAGIADAIDVAAGYSHSCALRYNGGVVCWGDGTYGEMGDGTAASSPTPIVVTGLGDAAQITAGQYFSCALRQTGEVNCWGLNNYYGQYYGMLGDGTNTTRYLANVPVSFLPDAVQISGSGETTCAVRSSGAVVCWGWNSYGQLGNNGNSPANAPVNVQGIGDAVEVSVHSSTACAVRATGAVACWGDNGSGQYGVGSMSPSLIAAPAETGVADAIHVSVGSAHSCVVRANNAIVCSGADAGGQLGDGKTAGQTTPVGVVGFP